MKRFELSIRKRILFTVLGAVLITYLLSLGFLTYRNEQQSLRVAMQAGRMQIEEYATQLSCDLNISLTLARNLSGIMRGVTPATWDARMHEFDRMCRLVAKSDYTYSEIWGTFDYNLQRADYPYKEGQFEII